MTFLWPELLWLLLLVPALVAAYLLALRRWKKSALSYSSLRVVRDAMGPARSARRHLPPLLFLLALVAMLAAIARPAAVLRLPSSHETVVLSMDISGSMKANDVAPDRIGAARIAAKSFVHEQPASTRIGVVEFSGSASLVQAPTGDRQAIDAALERLQPQHATAIGSGIVVALQAIFPGIALDPTTGKILAPREPVPAGSYASAAVILLTDGESNAGPDALEAARTASQLGVRVFTVGFGTPSGAVLKGEGWSMRVKLDERSLRGIAELTGGEYFQAATALDLKKVYQRLNSRLVLERKHIEITALFAAAAALAAMLAGGLSLAWFNRLL